MPQGTPCALSAAPTLDRHLLADKLGDVDAEKYFVCRLIHVSDGAVLVVVNGRVISERGTTADALADLAQCCQYLRDRG